jgi:hypothetical protein
MEMDPVTTFIIPGSAVPLRIHRDSGMDAVFVRGRPPLK